MRPIKVSVLLIDRSVSWINLFPGILFTGFIQSLAKNVTFFNRGYLYSDCSYSSSRDPFEIKFIVDALFLLSELAAKIKGGKL